MPRLRRSPEFDLISRIAELASAELGPGPASGIGDDAALSGGARPTATSVDACVEGVHFSLRTHTFEQVGAKAMARALSDLAAVGATPAESFVALLTPPERDADELVRVGAGLIEAARHHGIAVAGGDVSGAAELALVITVVGELDEVDSFVSRDGARPGDAIVVTGELGGSAAGLELLSGAGEGLAKESADALRMRHLEPQPRLAAGRALARAGARAMIDLSDGIGADAEHLAAAGGVRLELRPDALPIQAGVGELASSLQRDPLDLACAGEDYELLAVLDPAALQGARQACAEAGLALTEVGSVAEGSGAVWLTPDGPRPVDRGFDHLAR